MEYPAIMGLLKGLREKTVSIDRAADEIRKALIEANAEGQRFSYRCLEIGISWHKGPIRKKWLHEKLTNDMERVSCHDVQVYLD